MHDQRRSHPAEIVHEFQAGRVCEAVVDAIASAARADPLSIDPIHDAVDPDAVESLFRTGGSEVALRFHHEGFAVDVDGSGTIRVGTDLDS